VSDPIVNFCSEKFLLCFAATVLIFFTAGLLYLLRFERVNNLGAYSIQSETGLLIPSVIINYQMRTSASLSEDQRLLPSFEGCLADCA